ncbi:MAG: hypothetical protein TR69_WS6001000538 [candidate division WS6 bacterium OLB20]|uniref:Carbohydrate kinase PfkB domain-containing protein n=1 Tax=candidate division WS6 bacterium OLB20 TaxID=1617426 RepID=A0A136LY08_9BACT|nr:MAG: hypothetical protein TR69_WS6001000538 [candidate division WS6 bacterium OLB20]
MNSQNGRTAVLGSSTIETSLFLPEGHGYSPDVTSPMQGEVVTVGGSGACNALALQATGEQNIDFITVGGVTDEGYDHGAQSISRYMERKGIRVYQQPHAGTTEKVYMIISGNPEQPKIGVKHTDLRDRFQVTNDVRSRVTHADLVVASAFSPDVIAEVADGYRQANTDGVFAWTLNESSAEAIAQSYNYDDTIISRAIQGGRVSVMLASRNESATIDTHNMRASVLAGVPVILETRGADGVAVSYRNGNSYTLEIPTKPARKVNDNGAGEACHANFFACTDECQAQRTYQGAWR